MHFLVCLNQRKQAMIAKSYVLLHLYKNSIIFFIIGKHSAISFLTHACEPPNALIEIGFDHRNCNKNGQCLTCPVYVLYTYFIKNKVIPK